MRQSNKPTGEVTIKIEGHGNKCIAYLIIPTRDMEMYFEGCVQWDLYVDSSITLHLT